MGFFEEVQHWFKEDSDYGGRYIQKIIIQWEKSDKASFKKFISSELSIKLPQDYQLVQEYIYTDGRRADLAIIHKEHPLLLIEIKWNDTLIKESEQKNSQLADYVTICLKQESCGLLILTRESLSVGEIDCLGKLMGRGHHRYFGDISLYLNQWFVSKMSG